MNMNDIGLNQVQYRLTQLLNVYQPDDAISLVRIFMFCHEIEIKETLIDLSLLTDKDLEDAKEIIYSRFSAKEVKFIEEELETRYFDERERRTPAEVLYEWCY